MATTVFVLLLNLLLLGAVAEPPAHCMEDLKDFSPCLPFVSDPQHHDANDPFPPECWFILYSAEEKEDDSCLCYILRQPSLFGTPLNKERIAILNWDYACADAPAPPSPSTTYSGMIQNPSHSRFIKDSSDSTHSRTESAIK